MQETTPQYSLSIWLVCRKGKIKLENKWCHIIKNLYCSTQSLCYLLYYFSAFSSKNLTNPYHAKTLYWLGLCRIPQSFASRIPKKGWEKRVHFSCASLCIHSIGYTCTRVSTVKWRDRKLKTGWEKRNKEKGRKVDNQEWDRELQQKR